MGIPAAPTINPAKLAALKEATPRDVLRPAPDYIAPLVGWRAWKVSAKDGAWRLEALGMSGLWEPKKAMEAACSKGNAKHPAPHRDCECGIWSFPSLEALLPAIDGEYEVKVLGQVHIWGRIIECSNGSRSQFGYPKELWLFDESMEQLGYIYGVPIRTVSK